MATGRMLKKNISTSRRLANLKSDTARLIYTWMLPHLDIEGRFLADSLIIKGQIVPRLKISLNRIENILKELEEEDLIILYEIDGDRFLQFRKFSTFQTLRKDKERPSEIPSPPEIQDKDGSSTGVVRGKDKISKEKLITEQSSDKHSKEKKLHSGLVGNKLTSKEGDSDVVWDTHAKLFQYINEFNEKGDKISTDVSKKFKILAYYSILSKTKLENKAQWGSFVKRNIRIAGRIVEQGWTCKKVCFTAFLLEAKDLSWSLESVEKWLPRLDSELKKQKQDEEERYKDLFFELTENITTLNHKYGK